MPKKSYKLFVFLIVIVALAVVLYAWLGSRRPVAVAVKTVAYGTVQNTVANTRAGTIKACRRAGLSPSIGGQIARLAVKEGDAVTAGQLLVELWNHDQLAQLELATSRAKAAVAEARQVCINSEVAQREASRLKRLRKNKLASIEAVDKADGEARAQGAACNAARTNTEVSQAQIHVVESALEQTRLTAPFAGIVAEINGEIGEFVTPSPVGIPTPPAVDLVDISCLYVSAPIDEVDAPQIRVGMPANISLDAMAKKIFKGKVRRIAPYVLEIEKQARTVAVEVDFLSQEDYAAMLPGYSADIEVILQEHTKTLRVPTEAIFAGSKVLVFSDDDTLEERTIKTGLSNWVWTEVTGGLVQEEEVVVSLDRKGVADGVDAVRDTSSDND